MTDHRQSTENLFRRKYAEIVSLLLRNVGYEHFEIVEESVQEAFRSALEQWPHTGMPANPGGWLSTVARNKALDSIRREKVGKRKMETLQAVAETHAEPDDRMEENGIDYVAKMILLCCHPSLSPKAQVVLTLKAACGFSVKEIGRVLEMNGEAVKKIVSRAKQVVAKDPSPFQELRHDQIKDRFQIVIEVLYAIFTEGYAATGGEVQLRREMAEEALYLTGVLVSSPFVPESKSGEMQALLALMLFQSSRFDTRTDRGGLPVRLQDQDRSKWNAKIISAALTALELSKKSNHLSMYHTEARIAAEHSTSPSFEQTDWKRILSLYDDLLGWKDTIHVRLNRIVAMHYAGKSAASLLELERIRIQAEEADSFSFHCIRAELLEAAGRLGESQEAWQKALENAPTDGERGFLLKKLKKE